MFHHDLIPELLGLVEILIADVSVCQKLLHNFPIEFCLPDNVFDQERVVSGEKFPVVYAAEDTLLEADQLTNQPESPLVNTEDLLKQWTIRVLDTIAAQLSRIFRDLGVDRCLYLRRPRQVVPSDSR